MTLARAWGWLRYAKTSSLRQIDMTIQQISTRCYLQLRGNIVRGNSDCLVKRWPQWQRNGRSSVSIIENQPRLSFGEGSRQVLRVRSCRDKCSCRLNCLPQCLHGMAATLGLPRAIVLHRLSTLTKPHSWLGSSTFRMKAQSIRF